MPPKISQGRDPQLFKKNLIKSSMGTIDLSCRYSLKKIFFEHLLNSKDSVRFLGNDIKQQ